MTVGLLLGRLGSGLAAKDVVGGDRVERDDLSAMFGGIAGGLRGVGEGHGLAAAHAAFGGAADDEGSGFRVEPVIGARVGPCRGHSHVGDVDHGDVLRLLREQSESDGIASGGEPDWLVDAFEQQLALRSLMFCQHHAEETADGGVGKGVGGGLFGLLLAVAGRGRRAQG